MQHLVRDMIFEAIEEIGEISMVVREQIQKEMDVNVLKAMHKVAITSKSMKNFEEKIMKL